MKKKLAYQIIADHSLIIESYNGKFNVDELIAFKEKVGEDKDYHPNFNIIHDFRDIEFQLEIKEIAKYVKLISENEKYKGTRKSAMLTETPNQVTTAMGFDFLKKDLKIHVHVCSTIETVFTFIGLPKKDWELIASHITSLKS
ncbi:hypothetical protein BZG02_03130 [Labilibaculum filiforme]|uniref:Uncharacterized protein n=1 Tax=Labilibaculum filiforme TaxID=1940526 RepID=A0A2N3I3F2_9BACT|nr:hypothetical protein [Labilibaculum filiforme]PKQ64860.1 hypothetical protein BZG02_03130 [Labilibaculum filiforme]